MRCVLCAFLIEIRNSNSEWLHCPRARFGEVRALYVWGCAVGRPKLSIASSSTSLEAGGTMTIRCRQRVLASSSQYRGASGRFTVPMRRQRGRLTGARARVETILCSPSQCFGDCSACTLFMFGPVSPPHYVAGAIVGFRKVLQAPSDAAPQ